MGKLLKHTCLLVPALLLAAIVLIIPQINNSELMNPTQSGKAFGLLASMLSYVAVVLFVAAINREILTISITTVDVLLAAFGLMVAVSYGLYPNDGLQMLSFVALVVFYLGVRMLNRKYQLLLLVAIAVSGTIQAVYGNLQLWGYYPSYHGLFRMTGSFFNPGPYAGYLAAIFPVALALYFRRVERVGRVGNVERVGNVGRVGRVGRVGIVVEKVFERVSVVWNMLSKSNSSNGEAPNSPNPSNREAPNPSNPPNPSNGAAPNPSNGGAPNPSNSSNSSNLSNSSNFYNFYNIFAVISMIAMCLVLPASRSRAAWLAVVVSAGYLLWIQYNPLQQLREWVNTPVKRLLLVSSLVVLLVFSGAGLYYLKKDSADGRLLIWKVSGQMIKDQPIFGQGAGKFAADYMNYQAAYFAPAPDVPESLQADNVTYAYNEFLKLTVENGLVGLLLALALLWSLFFLKSDSGGNKRSNLSLLAARGGLLSILVFSLFSYPSDILPIRMLLVLLMAIVASHQNPVPLFKLSKNETAKLPSQRKAFAVTAVWYAALAVALVTVYPAGKYINRQYQAYQSWKDGSDIYNVGAYPECLEDFELAYPLLKTNGSFLVQYGKALEMAEKYESSVTILNQAKQHLNNTILYTCLGNNYKALGKHPEAEQAYLHAFNMAPARFYPLYLLAKLYDETGQTEKAVAMAKEVMEKEVKIESTAVKEIQEEMRSIIEKQAHTQNMSNSKGKNRKHNHQVAMTSCSAPFLKRK